MKKKEFFLDESYKKYSECIFNIYDKYEFVISNMIENGYNINDIRNSKMIKLFHENNKISLNDAQLIDIKYTKNSGHYLRSEYGYPDKYTRINGIRLINVGIFTFDFLTLN